VGPPPRRPPPLRPPDHADPRPGVGPDLLGPFRPADRRRVPEVVSEAAPLERRVPLRQVLARRGRAPRSRHGAADRVTRPRRARPGHCPLPGDRGPAPRGVRELAVDRRPDPRHERPGLPGSGAPRPLRRPDRGAPDGRRPTRAAGRRRPGGRGRGRSGMRRLLLLAATLAVLLTPVVSILPAGTPGAAIAVAAASGLTTTADARYTVDPAGHRVRVIVTLAATNHLSDTRTHRYFYDRAYVSVPPRTSGFRISSPGAHPSVSVAARRSTYTLLRIGFGTHLAAGSTRSFRIGFEMPDPGGTATRTTRIGLSLVRFSAWGLASDGAAGGSVTVVFPSGFNVDAQGGS